MSNRMVRVKDLTKTFYDDAGPINVLKDTSFSVKKGEIVKLVGMSGAGKTTLLHILGGLESYTSGKVEVNGREIGAMKPHELSRFRGKSIGFVFQFHYLLPDFTALENVVIPGMIVGKAKRQCISKAKELLSIMGLDNRITHFPSELSGGERQRVALARALFNEPALILADEPTGNLDNKNSGNLINLINKTNKELNQTFLIATHNEHLTESMHRTLLLEDGKVISNV